MPFHWSPVSQHNLSCQLSTNHPTQSLYQDISAFDLICTLLRLFLSAATVSLSFCLNSSSDSHELMGNDYVFHKRWTVPLPTLPFLQLWDQFFIINSSCCTASFSSCWKRNINSRNWSLTYCEKVKKMALWTGVLVDSLEDETRT